MRYPERRMRRLRLTPLLRNLVSDIKINLSDLIYPIFIDQNISKPEPIPSMPNQFRFPLNLINEEINEILSLGIHAIILFGIPSYKDELGSSAYDKNGIIPQAIKMIKKEYKDKIIIISDNCLCQYTNHGHCGIYEQGYLQNDKTLELLQKIALVHAKAGVDIVAPSGMLDGQVQAIRSILDENNFNNVNIMSYSAKFASAFYGPFRDAADSAPSFGDRKSYQMDYSKRDEALIEVELDIKEGADIIMVKPALSYLDLIYRVKKKYKIPLAAYNVSGEYSMIKAAANLGWINEKDTVLEILTSIKRAGTNMIITYFAKQVAGWLLER
ncbi:MAG: porphobilinogen synthase [Candidatus Odinarchaeota archaeon]